MRKTIDIEEALYLKIAAIAKKNNMKIGKVIEEVIEIFLKLSKEKKEKT